MTLAKLLQRYAGKTSPREGEQAVLTPSYADEPEVSLQADHVISKPEEATVQTPSVVVMPSFELAGVSYITEPAQLESVIPVLCQSSILAIDGETTGLDPHQDRLCLLQVATPEHTFVIDARRCAMQALAPVFTVEHRIIGHNLKFDLKFLVAAGLPWPMGEILDTLLAAQVIGAGTPEGLLKGNGLEAVVKRYLGISLDKSAQTSDWSGPLSDVQRRYAAIDAAILIPLAEALDAALQSAGLERIAALEGDAMRALAWIECVGLPVDVAHWEARADDDRQQAAEALVALQAIAGDNAQPGERPVNWQSSPQVLRLLQACGHAIARVDAPTLLPLKDRDPLIAALLAYREAVKRTSTYGHAWLQNYVHPATGRVHADYLPLGGRAGRISCHSPNVQNLPRGPRYRGAIKARDGFRLVKADYSQIELRLAAVIAPDRAMLAAFQAGVDVHRHTAAEVLGVPLEAVTGAKRQLAKAINFGLLYGMGAPRLRDYAALEYGVQMTETEAIHHRQRFFHAYRGLSRWHQHTSARLRAEGTIETRTLAGRRRLDVDKFTEGLNSPTQGACADTIKLALARLFKHRDEVPDARLIATVHDEILAECPEDATEATAQWLVRHMTAAMQELVGDRVLIVVEATSGRSWAGGDAQ
jgi:DNA polymerase I